MALERFVVRRFYGDRLAALVATWGVSLILSQGALLALGPSMPSVPLPAWTLHYEGYSFGGYRLLLFAIALAAIVATWWVFYRTKIGIRTRATMQNRAGCATSFPLTEDECRVGTPRPPPNAARSRNSFVCGCAMC